MKDNPLSTVLEESLSKVFEMEAAETQMHPIVNVEGEVVISEENPDDFKQLENDHEYTRRNIMKLLSKSDSALASALELVSSSESPRAIEALSTLMKTLADINGTLLDSHLKVEQVKSKKKLKGEPLPVSHQQTNNTLVFNGTTDEFQKFIKEKKKLNKT